MQRRSARQLLGMWVHAYFFSATCNKHWAVIGFGDICLSAYPCSCSYTLTNPPPHTLPYYPRTKHLSCPLSQFKTIGGGLPPSERGRKTYDWRAAATTWFVFVLVATCTMACQDLTPGLAPSQHPCMQTHFTPTFSPPDNENLLFTHNPPTIHTRHCSPLLGRCPSCLEFLFTPWQAFTNGLGCTPLLPSPHFTRAAHLPHPLPK